MEQQDIVENIFEFFSPCIIEQKNFIIIMLTENRFQTTWVCLQSCSISWAFKSCVLLLLVGFESD